MTTRRPPGPLRRRAVWTTSIAALAAACVSEPGNRRGASASVDRPDVQVDLDAPAGAEPDADAFAPPRSPASSEDSPASGDGPHGGEDVLAVVSAEVDVKMAATADAVKVGTLRAGGFARRRGSETRGPSAGCQGGWWAVEPRGFVCGDGVTRDATDPRARLYSEYGLGARAALPASYGIAEATPLYSRLPSAAEQAIAEPGIDKRWRKLGNEQRTAKIDVPPELLAREIAPSRPAQLAPDIPVVGVLENHARVAWVAEFDAPERSWLLTPEFLFVPSDRVKRAAISAFHGVAVANNAGVAFTGNQGVGRYAKSEDGRRYLPQRQTWPPLTPVLLAEPALSFSDEKFLETSEPGVFIRANEVIVAHPTPPSRWGLEPDARFVEINVRTNLLLLHDGNRVTFATLVSVGRLGSARGKFRIFAKHLTAPSLLELPHAPTRGAETPELMRMTDTPDRPNEATAIPMFAAWWANAWGTPNGGPGISLAPLDARRIFDETEPTLPEGWHSVRGDGTWVIIHD